MFTASNVFRISLPEKRTTVFYAQPLKRPKLHAISACIRFAIWTIISSEGVNVVLCCFSKLAKEVYISWTVFGFPLQTGTSV